MSFSVEQSDRYVLQRVFATYGVDPDECNVYAQKSWAVIKKEGNFAVKEHDHIGAVLSAVYYVEAQPNDLQLYL